MSRRCDEEGNWQEIDITKCHRLTPKEAVDKGKQLSNIPTEKKVNLPETLLMQLNNNNCVRYGSLLLSEVQP